MDINVDHQIDFLPPSLEDRHGRPVQTPADHSASLDAPIEDDEDMPELENGSTDEEEEHDLQDESLVDSSDDDEEDVVTNKDSLFARKFPDVQSLIAPLPALSPKLTIPALLLAREFNGLTNYMSPALLRQKLAGQRELLQRFALWTTLDHHQGCL